MRDYELIVLVSPQVADEEVPAVVDKVKQFVSNHGGEIAAVNPWGRRRLAYHIGDFQEATYVKANFKMDSAHVADLESNLRLSEQVLRHLLVRVGQ